MNKKLILIASLLVLMAAIIYAGLWHAWARQVEARAIEIRAALTAQGTQLEGQFSRIAGFPGPLELTFSGMIVAPTQALHLPFLSVRGFFLPGTTLEIEMPQGVRVHAPELDEFSSSLDSISLTARIPAQLPADFTARDLSRWKDAGGKIIVKDVQLRKSTLNVKGNGEITLDDRLQPALQLPVAMTGHGEFLTELQTRKITDSRQALIAGAVLGALAKPNADNIPEVAILLSIQKSTLYAGPIRITDIPPVFWPE